METRLAVTHRKDNRMFPLYDNSLNLLPQIIADWLDDELFTFDVVRQPPRRLRPKTMLWARHCCSGLQEPGRFYRIPSSFPCVCGVAGRSILQGCRCFWQRVTDLFHRCILQSGPVNTVCLVLLYTLWKTGRIPNLMCFYIQFFPPEPKGRMFLPSVTDILSWSWESEAEIQHGAKLHTSQISARWQSSHLSVKAPLITAPGFNATLPKSSIAVGRWQAAEAFLLTYVR